MYSSLLSAVGSSRLHAVSDALTGSLRGLLLLSDT